MQVIGNHLVTGGSDGRVILYDLASYECLHRICAHDNSITAMHFDERYILSASNDGRIKLWDTRTGDFIRELSMPSEGIWRLAVKDDRVYIFLSRERKTVIEFLTFRPEEVE
jgi:F-box and WD-40 domain protein CDC4